MEIRILKRQGLSVREIARRTGHSRNTVDRHLKREGNPVYTARPLAPSKLDAHKAFVSERIAAAHPERLPGTVLLGVAARNDEQAEAQSRRFRRTFT